jgi:hypothetical protein
MYTTILAYVIVIGTGVWGLVYLLSVAGDRPPPLRYHAMMIAMICGGFGLGGIAQGLRVLVAIATRLQ